MKARPVARDRACRPIILPRDRVVAVIGALLLAGLAVFQMALAVVCVALASQ